MLKLFRRARGFLFIGENEGAADGATPPVVAGGGGGSGVGAVVAAGAKAFTQEDLNKAIGEAREAGRKTGAREARDSLLGKAKGHGATSEDDLLALAKLGAESKAAQMTAEEKSQARVKELEAQHKEAIQRAEKAELTAKRTTLFADANVSDRELATLLHDQARIEAVARGETLDDAKWLDEQKTKRAFLFKGEGTNAQQGAAGATSVNTQRAPANTTTSGNAQTPPARTQAGQSGDMNYAEMSDAEFDAHERKQALDSYR